MNHISGKLAVKLNLQNFEKYLQSCKTAKDTGKCNLSKLFTAFPASNNLQNWCHIELNITSFYGNIHSKLSLVSMLKDHVTLLNLNLHGFCYPRNFFWCVLYYDCKNRRYYEYYLQVSFSC